MFERVSASHASPTHPPSLPPLGRLKHGRLLIAILNRPIAWRAGSYVPRAATFRFLEGLVVEGLFFCFWIHE